MRFVFGAKLPLLSLLIQIKMVHRGIAHSSSRTDSHNQQSGFASSWLNENGFDCNVIFIEFPQKGLEESSIPGGIIRRLKFMLMHFLKENVFEPCLQSSQGTH